MNRRWNWPSFTTGLFAASVVWFVVGPYRPAITIRLAAPAVPEPPLVLPGDEPEHFHPIREHSTWPHPRTAEAAP